MPSRRVSRRRERNDDGIEKSSATTRARALNKEKKNSLLNSLLQKKNTHLLLPGRSIALRANSASTPRASAAVASLSRPAPLVSASSKRGRRAGVGVVAVGGGKKVSSSIIRAAIAQPPQETSSTGEGQKKTSKLRIGINGACDVDFVSVGDSNGGRRRDFFFSWWHGCIIRLSRTRAAFFFFFFLSSFSFSHHDFFFSSKKSFFRKISFRNYQASAASAAS